MKVTIPRYGNSIIGMKIILDGLKIPYILPEPNHQDTLDLGLKYAPDEVCQPFKMMLGNYIQSIRKGADTIILLATNGPCRFGEYANLQERLLKKAGFQAKFIVLHTQGGRRTFLDGLARISALSSRNRVKKIFYVFLGLYGMLLMDKIEKKCRYLSGFELEKGACKELLSNCNHRIMDIHEPIKAIHFLKSCKKKVNKISLEPQKNPLKIAIIGEIYTISEPFSSKFVEDQLMESGISVSRSLTPSWWLKNFITKILKLPKSRVDLASKEYIYTCAGGYTRETVGKALLAYKKGYDGAIQIFPVGCTPEIIAKPILEKISEDKAFPILTLIVDEMSGEEGIVTRLEAFRDLLERRREKCII